MRPLCLAVALALSACAHPHGAHHRFERAEDWAPRFEDPSRDAWQRPDEVLRALALPPTAKVADVGAATGYFPVRLARALPQGKVYGVDVEPSMVAYLADRAQKEGLGNLEAILGAADDPKIPEPVDLVLLVDTYHHVDGRPAYFQRLAKAVAPGGRLAVIDFRPGSKLGPDHKLAPEIVKRELDEAGWALVQDVGSLPEQYFLIFKRK